MASFALEGTSLIASLYHHEDFADFDIQIMNKTTSGRDFFTRIAAYGLVVNSNHQLLMCRLSATVPWVQGKWTLPGGGIEFGEKPQDTVVREVHEETGLIVEPLNLAGVDSYVTENDNQSFHNIRIVFYTRLIAGELQHEQDGSTDLCQWFSPAEANRLPKVSLGQIGLKWAFRKELT